MYQKLTGYCHASMNNYTKNQKKKSILVINNIRLRIREQTQAAVQVFKLIISIPTQHVDLSLCTH